MIPGVVAGGAMGGGSAPSLYTTLNPADKSANVTLSGGNLTAVGDVSGSGFARSVQAIAGKKYFEAVFNNSTGFGAVIAAGIATSTATLTGSLGYSTSDGWAFWGSNVGARHGGSTAVAGTSAAGDVFGFAVDEPNGEMWIRKNGTWIQGDPETGTSPIWTDLSGTLYAAACPWDIGASITMRFDPASFRDAAPAGFDPILA
jgi:hypothetical protein